MSGVRGVWRRLVGGGTDLVEEEMSALEERLAVERLRRGLAELTEDRALNGVWTWPEEIVWPL